ncbi:MULTISPECIES: TetR/AcrR family transcriptional regulator [unclassified Paenibacillus]|nr:TetR/AcrR family transcriptional regulator [Paenibacillus sp. FSL H7-0737]
MYTRNNPIALQSQKMITDALLLLMENKEFSKINIKELCDKALVSRQTFYSLFKSKEQVIELYFDKLFADYVQPFEETKESTVSEVCNSAISYLISKKNFISLLVRNNLNYIMIHKFEQYLIQFGNIINAPQREDQEYAMAFISGALVEVIARYIKNNASDSPTEISMLVEQIITGRYFR